MIFNMVGGGGGSGATLVVSSPANVSVTVSKDDKSYTKNSGSLGSATFKGLATGTWTVVISGNGQTATKTIEITADYAITIAFFSAFINITYPATSTCVVTNSGGQTVASDTNTGSSTKAWTATVGATGTYTVTATATDGSGKTKSTTVSVTADGQSSSVTLSYELVLFDNGNYDQETGGWEAATDGYNASYDIAETTPELIVAKSSSSASGFARCYTKSKVDLTEIKTIVFNVKFSQTNNFFGKVGIANTQTPDFTKPSDFVAYKSLSVSTEYIDVSIDVSSLSGSYYVVLGGYKGGYGQINCKKILGERL